VLLMLYEPYLWGMRYVCMTRALLDADVHLAKEEVVLGVILSEVKAAAIAQGPGVPHEVAC